MNNLKQFLGGVMVTWAAMSSCLAQSANDLNGKPMASPVSASDQQTQSKDLASKRGDQKVDLFTGSFSYSIPISCAPARNGSEPNLALLYSSSGGNDWCGMGWKLDIGYIERNIKDGFPIAFSTAATPAPLNQYDDSRGFILNLFGKEIKLLPVGGNEYRPEVDTDFLRCVLDTANNKWAIYDKSGNVYYFGQASSSRVINTKTGWSGNSSATFHWALDQIDTPMGDRTTVTYTTYTANYDSTYSGQPERTIYPTIITYNGHANINGNGYGASFSGTHTISFTTEARPDWRFSYRWGFRTEQNRRLTAITCQVGSQYVSRYQLGYTISPATGRSLLHSVTVYGSDNATALPVQTFTYQGNVNGVSFSPMFQWTGLSLNTPGHSGSYEPNLTQINIMGGFSYTVADLVDIDGDGLPDRVNYDDTTQPNQYWVQKNQSASGSTSFGARYAFAPSSTATSGMTAIQATTASSANPLPDDSGYAQLNTPYGRIRDIDGDGLPDRVMDYWKAFNSSGGFSGVPFTNLQVMLNNGNGFSGTAVPWAVTNPVSASDPNQAYAYYYCIESGGINTGFFDIDGDGRPDRVMSQYGGSNYPRMTNFFVQFNTGSNFTGMKSFGPYKSQNLYANGNNLSNPGIWAGIETPEAHMIDINGDGLPDRLMYPMNPSSGGNELPHPTSYFAAEFNDGYSFEAVDTTTGYGGAADHWPGVFAQASNNTLIYWQKYGNRLFLSDAIWDLPYTGLYDLNGDGLPDHVVVDLASITTSSPKWNVYLNNGHGFNTTPIVVAINNQSHYTAATDYDWYSMQGSSSVSGPITTLVDINGDGLLDRVMSDYNNINNAENGGTPSNPYFLVQTNMGPFPDLLINVDNGIGGIIGITYKPSTSYDNRKDPTVANSGSILPFVQQTVASVTTSDGVNAARTTSYGYAGGFFDGSRREFAGFAVVTNTEPLAMGATIGRKTITYFHQGGGRDYSTLGEYLDAGNFAKRGMPYRIETWGNDSPTPLLYHMVINQVDQTSLGNARFFPFTSQTFEYDYPGGGTPRITGSKFVYTQIASDNNIYNLTTKILWGEVSGVSLTSIATPSNNTADDQYYQYTYASIAYTPPAGGTFYISDHPLTNSLTDVNNNVIQQTAYTYNSPSGTVLTKQQQICAGTYAVKTYNTYNSYGLPTSITDSVGVPTTIVYDSTYNIYPATTTVGSSGNTMVTTTAYDVRSGLLTTSTDPMGINMQNVYDVFFRLTETDKGITPGGAANALWLKKITYPPTWGTITSGNAVNYADVQLNDGVGGVESRTYVDGFGRPIQTRTQGENGNYRVTSTVYDERGEAFLTTWPRFEGAVGFTKPNTIANPQPASFIGYDAAGRVNLKRRRVDATFDGNGAFLSASTTGTAAGDTGSLLAAEQWSFVNNTDPWWKIYTDEDGKVRRYQYDAFGRNTNIQEVVSGSTYATTMLKYDLAGNLTNILNQNGENIYFGYDMAGNKVAMADPHLGQWTYQRDAAGRLRVQTDARGDVVTYSYATSQQDPLGRVQQKNVYNSVAAYNANTPASTATYTYDVNNTDNSTYPVYKGLLYMVTDSEGWEKNGYDTRGRLTITTRHLNINNQNYTTTYTYNDDDKVTSIGYPNSGPTINYSYWTGGNLKQVANNLSFSGNVYYSVGAGSYDEFGHVTSFAYGNGVTTTRSYYSNSKRLQTISAGSVMTKTYQYSPGDDVLNISGTGLSSAAAITYDDLHRIKTDSSLGGSSYVYDTVGNITTSIEGGGSAYTYGSRRLEAVKGAFNMSYLYDLCGNMIVRHGGATGSQALAYDAENQLKVFSQAGTTVVEYGYADDGARLWKRVNQDPNQVQLWIGKIYEEKNDTAVPSVKHTLFHVFAGDQQVCTFEAGSALAQSGGSSSLIGYYYHEDNLNSSSVLSSSGGAQQEYNVYFPFGRTQATSSQPGTFQISRQFTGQVKDDETGLYYYNARYYDPELGRFIQPDTSIPDLGNPQSYNRYTYCLNNPLRYTDPDGHWAQEVADWWSSTVSAGAGHISAGPSHWIYNGTVGSLSSLVGGLAAPLTLGSAAGHVYGNPNATGKEVLLASVTEAANLAAVIPAAAGIGKGVGMGINALRTGTADAAAEAAGDVADAALSGSCFAAGTLVQTPNGFVAIEDITEGDTVLAYDFSAGQVVERKVMATINHITDYWVLVGVGGEEIKATRSHRFWVESANAWVAAVDLKPGMTVRCSDGRIVAINSVKVIELPKSEETFNLIVDTDHDYFVGTAQVLVHNGTPLDEPGHSNYHLEDANGKTYYHGRFGPNSTLADVEARHAANGDRFSRANRDVPVLDQENVTYGESRVNEHNAIKRDGTLIGRDPNTMRGNRQNGISDKNMPKYENVGGKPKIKC